MKHVSCRPHGIMEWWNIGMLAWIRKLLIHYPPCQDEFCQSFTLYKTSSPIVPFSHNPLFHNSNTPIFQLWAKRTKFIMGIGIRIFLVNDDDSIRRFPLTRFERLIRRDPEERLRPFAGKPVRCAEVALKLEQRKPIEYVFSTSSYHSILKAVFIRLSRKKHGGWLPRWCHLRL